MKKIRFGTIHADYVTASDALDKIEFLVASGVGGYVVTPNVDHIVLAQKNARLRRAYDNASLSLADGKPLLWMSSILGKPLPEKISGSDFIIPALQRAASANLRVYFLGAGPGVAQTAADRMTEEIERLQVVGVDSPPLGFEKDETLEKRTMDKMMATKPDLVFLALGCPKQELLAYKWHSQTAPIVYLGIGASLDFLAGNVKRCPQWMAEAGVEWLYRISQDPKRMAHRYLMRDAAVLPIFFKMFSAPKDETFFEK